MRQRGVVPLVLAFLALSCGELQQAKDSAPGQGGEGAGPSIGQAGAPGQMPEPYERFEIYGVTYGLGRFVAVGAHVTEQGHAGVVLSSVDGQIWQEQVREPDVSYWDVLFGSERFVTVGGGFSETPSGLLATGRAVVSSDGTAWEQVTLPAAPAAFHAAFGDGIFMATAGDSTLSSADGVKWTSDPGGTDLVGGIEFVNGNFMRWGNGSEVAVWGEVDAWVHTDVAVWAPVAGYQTVTSVRAVGDSFEAIVVRGDDCDEGCLVHHWARATSKDGAAWEFSESELSQPPLQVLFESEAVCVAWQQGAPGTAEELLSGPDCNSLGDVWSGASVWPHAAVVHDGTYVIGTTRGVLVSHDGSAWQLLTLVD